MKFVNPKADIFVPDGIDPKEALSRTTYLSISAHQDDCEIMAYHAIAECYDSDKDWFTAIVLTDGGGSPRSGKYANYTNEQISVKRSQEQRDAACVGKYSAVVQLAYSSEEVRTSKCDIIEDELVELIKAARPKYVFIHNPADRHETHLGASLRAIYALRKLPAEYLPERVYGMEVWRSLDWLSASDRLIFDTSKHPEIEKGVITAFESQCNPLKRFDLAAIGRRLANATFQEPRANDTTSSCNIGVDLTPLIKNHDLDIKKFTLDLVMRFYGEVNELLTKFVKGN